MKKASPPRTCGVVSPTGLICKRWALEGSDRCKLHGEQSPTCGAKTRSGGTCQKAPVPGRARCRLHGGASLPAGPMHPTYKHGRYSKGGIPKGLREHLERAEADPDLMSLREEIVVIQAVIAERLAGIGEGGLADHTDNLRKLTETKARLVLAEWKRQVELGLMLSAESIHALTDRLAEIIKDVVRDRDLVAEIGRRFAEFYGHPNRQETCELQESHR